MLRAEIVTDLSSLSDCYDAWDELAVENGRPFCAPAWMLSWWRHLRPERAELRAVIVRAGESVVGIAPFFCQVGGVGPVRYRLLGSRASGRLEPLARRDQGDAVAALVARSLASVSPRPDLVVFEGVPTMSTWPALLRDAWPGRPPWRRRSYPTVAPTLTLEETSFEEWFKSRPSHFRQEVRRRRRRLEERGAVFRLASTEEEVERDLQSFYRLHYARWRDKGGSGVLTPQVERLLSDAAAALVASGRFRVWSIDVDGETISSQIFVAAGGEVAYWLGGFDASWAKLGPAIQAVLVAAEDAWERGDKRLDLGAGAQEYKYSFADGQDVLEWVSLAPRGGRYPLTRLQLAPQIAREAVSKRLSPETRTRIKQVLSGRLSAD